MTKKMVVHVQMNDAKCWTAAMKVVASAKGVNSIAIEGDDKDRVVVIGDGFDAIELTRSLRKKLGYACIVSVEDVKKKKDPTPTPTPTPKPNPTPTPTPIQWPQHYIHRPAIFEVVYDPSPCNCPIM